MGNISKNFFFSEFEHSDLAVQEGIVNTIPSAEVGGAILDLTRSVLQPLRDSLGASVYIVSGYRCDALNAKLGDSRTSQHRKGEAADIRSPFFSPIEIARRIVALQLPFDQIIIRPSYVHVSHKKNGAQRGKVLYDISYKGDMI